MRRALRWSLLPPTVLFAATVLYGVGAFVLGVIPLNSDYRPVTQGIDIFVRSNGIHADLIVPVSAAGIDWHDILPIASLPSLEKSTGYLAFGWGDRGFYLATPRWSDLRVATALDALLGLDTTVLHVEALDVAPLAGPSSRHLRVTPEGYRRLADFVEASFEVDARGMKILVPQARYGMRDAFFEARGRYSLFVTCNEWTRRALAKAGVRVPIWAPIDKAILFQLARDE